MAVDPLDLPFFSPERPATFDGGLKYYEQLLALKRLIEELENMRRRLEQRSQ